MRTKHLSIEDLKEDIHISAVLNYLGAQDGYGSSWSEWVAINCPFHKDDNASASMNPKAGLFLCHGCGAPDRPNGKAGDVIDVAKFHLGTDSITEAISWLQETFQ